MPMNPDDSVIVLASNSMLDSVICLMTVGFTMYILGSLSGKATRVLCSPAKVPLGDSDQVILLITCALDET